MADSTGAVKGLFVTGTDTGVGKSLVAASLARYLTGRGLKVGVMKPVETGVENPEGLGPDGALLKWAVDAEVPDELISPYRFRQPLAPSLAAREDGESIHLDRLLETARDLGDRCDFLIVEGAGGLMVPLAGALLIGDLVKQMGLPLLVVSRPDLGTINHTLLTTLAAKTLDIPLAGFFINGMPAEPDQASALAPKALVTLASADLLGVLPRVEGDERQKVEALCREIAVMDTLPWLLMNLGLRQLL